MGSSSLTRMEPGPLALEAQTFSHWATRKFPKAIVLKEGRRDQAAQEESRPWSVSVTGPAMMLGSCLLLRGVREVALQAKSRLQSASPVQGSMHSGSGTLQLGKPLLAAPEPASTPTTQPLLHPISLFHEVEHARPSRNTFPQLLQPCSSSTAQLSPLF